MTTVGLLLQEAAATLPYWRHGAIAALAGVVIGSLYLYASLVGES